MSVANTSTAMTRESERHATFKDVKDDVRHLKEDVKDAVTHTANQGIQAAREGAETALDKTVETGRRAADSALATHERLCEHIARHPTASILIAFGVGALASRVFSRK